MKSGPLITTGRRVMISERRIVAAAQFQSRGFAFVLCFVGAIEREDRDGRISAVRILASEPLGWNSRYRSPPSTSMKAPFFRQPAHSPNFPQT
jgi:hypothetical protein